MATGQLKTLIPDIGKQRVVPPQFQRDFVWPPAAVTKLLVSLFNGYPIGSLLLMENNGTYDFRPIDGVSETSLASPPQETLLVLDGQQRLTSCYRAFVGTVDKEFKYAGRYYFNYLKFVSAAKAEEEISGSGLEEFFLFVKAPKVNKDLKNTADETSRGLLPLDVIFGEPRGSNYADWLSRFSFAVSKGQSPEFEILTKISSRFITEFIERVTGYQINYETITRDTKPDVICTVFETINTTGVKLTVFDLLVAKCFKNNIRLRDQLDDALSKFDNIRYFDPTGSGIASIHLPRIIGLLHNTQCKKGDLLQLPAEAIGHNWTNAVVALDKILGLMRSSFGCVKSDFIPSIDVISPLAVIVSDLAFSKELHFGRLSRLYWNLVFSLYLSGSPETKSSKIVREWRGGYRDADDSPPDVIRNFSFVADELDESTKISGVYKGVMTLAIALGARDFDAKQTLLKDAQGLEIEDHHIYPQQFLRNFGIKGHLANSILNRTPILGSTNRQIASDAPHAYVAEGGITGAGGLTDEQLKLHFISGEIIRKEFSPSLFSKFRLDRRLKILAAISKATGQDLTPNQLTIDPQSI